MVTYWHKTAVAIKNNTKIISRLVKQQVRSYLTTASSPSFCMLSMLLELYPSYQPKSYCLLSKSTKLGNI